MKKRKRTPKVAAVVVVLPKKEVEREELLFQLLCDLDPTQVKMKDALHSLYLKTGLSPHTLKRYPGKYDWNIRWKAHHDKKNKTVTAVDVNTALGVILQRKDEQLHTPFSVIAAQLKDLAFLVVSTNRDMVRTCATMMGFYNQKAQAVMERWNGQSGGLKSISKTDQALIETYMAKAKEYYMLVKPYMDPSALLGILDQLSMKEALGVVPDGVEESAFTPAALLKKLENLAMIHGGHLAGTIANAELVEVVRGEVLGEMPDAPEIDGHKVRDEENRINLDRPKTAGLSGEGDDQNT